MELDDGKPGHIIGTYISIYPKVCDIVGRHVFLVFCRNVMVKYDCISILQTSSSELYFQMTLTISLSSYVC